MSRTIYYLNIKRKTRNTAGMKAPNDIDDICKSLGLKAFSMPQFPSGKGPLYKKIWLAIICPIYWCKLWMTVYKGDIIIYQHPMYGNRISAFFIPKIQKYKNCKFIAIIHDLESLRKGIQGVVIKNPKTIEVSDNKLLKEFDVLICHNDHMKQYLINQGFDSNKLICLEIFDYLCNYTGKVFGKGKISSIAIAGNLASGKSEYIYSLFDQKNKDNLSLEIHLYGENFDESKKDEKMIYHGSYRPEELPVYLEGDFGLVWDGTSADTCAGNTGEYLKYNNPHKTSLYLASGIPVIVWSQAAISDFILKNNLGIAVDDLHNLDKIISNISNDRYNYMLENVKVIGKKIRTGEYFKTALKKALAILEYSSS